MLLHPRSLPMAPRRCLQAQALREASDYDQLLAQLTKAKAQGVELLQIECAEERLLALRKQGKHVNSGCDKETLRSFMQWEKASRGLESVSRLFSIINKYNIIIIYIYIIVYIYKY